MRKKIRNFYNILSKIAHFYRTTFKLSKIEKVVLKSEWVNEWMNARANLLIISAGQAPVFLVVVGVAWSDSASIDYGQSRDARLSSYRRVRGHVAQRVDRLVARLAVVAAGRVEVVVAWEKLHLLNKFNSWNQI